VIVLDTHGLLWLDREDPALGPSSRERISTAWGKGLVAVCAISFWEVAMLAARGRVELRQSPESWRGDWLRAGLEEIALNGALAVAATAMGRAATMNEGTLGQRANPSFSASQPSASRSSSINSARASFH